MKPNLPERRIPVLLGETTQESTYKPNLIDLEVLDDPTIIGRFTRFDELNEDSIQLIWRDPSDGMLDQEELKKLAFVNDWQFPFRTAIWRYRMNSRNPFLFWDTLYPDSQSKIVKAYGLQLYLDLMYFFIWLIKEDKLNTTTKSQRIVELFNAADSDTQTKLIEDYNNSLNNTI